MKQRLESTKEARSKLKEDEVGAEIIKTKLREAKVKVPRLKEEIEKHPKMRRSLRLRLLI